jgi:hypothetical protein
MALTVAAAPQWQRLVANPRTNEVLLVTQDANQGIYAQACTGNTWFAGTPLNGTPAPHAAHRSFDVAYENLSGHGLAVYADNTVNVRYQGWNGTAWTVQSNVVGFIPTPSGSNCWVRLVAQPGSDNILCLVRWQIGSRTNYSSAMVWNGTGWGNSASLESNCVAEIAYENDFIIISSHDFSLSYIMILLNESGAIFYS